MAAAIMNVSLVIHMSIAANAVENIPSRYLMARRSPSVKAAAGSRR